LKGFSFPSELRVPSGKNMTLTRSRTAITASDSRDLSDSLPSRSTGMLPASRIVVPKMGTLNSSRLATHRVCLRT
jgi:hypothetical protein